MQIRTLAEILAESEADSASSSTSKKQPSVKHGSKRQAFTQDFKQRQSKSKPSFATSNKDQQPVSTSNQPSNKPANKRKKRFHPAAHFIAEANDTPSYRAPEAQTIKQILAEIKGNNEGQAHDKSLIANHPQTEAPLANNVESDIASSETDNLPSALKAYLRTPEQRQAEVDAIKAESRLRWLAFYYLSRREYGKAELRQKLIDKEQDPEQIDALLDEFETKGYQSDYRTTLMLIRESIRKGRGRGRIKQEFYHKKIAMPSNVDELIDLANAESDEFSEFVDDSADSMVTGVDWLKLAVTARTKKYGDNIPSTQKDKAKQLRFLQYRGFNGDICFEALNYTLDNLEERF